MMIDFAIEAERDGGLTSEQAIYKACVLRFRPILMTTLAAPLRCGAARDRRRRRLRAATAARHRHRRWAHPLAAPDAVHDPCHLLFLDRFSRNVRDFLVTLERLNELEVGFISVQEKLDTSGPAGRLMVTVLMALAQFEREQTGMRVKAIIKHKQAQGEPRRAQRTEQDDHTRPQTRQQDHSERTRHGGLRIAALEPVRHRRRGSPAGATPRGPDRHRSGRHDRVPRLRRPRQR